MLDHLRQRTLDPSGIRILVLDEADEMLSMGFARELNAILETLPKNRQGLFFSATIPPDIERLAHTHLRTPSSSRSRATRSARSRSRTTSTCCSSGDKVGQLVRILEVEDPESAIIFCNTRDETQRVAEALKTRGFDADWLNGDLPQNDRERVMSATREGRLRFLVATDVAARGIDISHLTHVINYDFPETAEQYVHRTGRTGRAGRTGTAIALVGPKDIGNLYLLRLTYKIRPIEKQLPSAGELKTRAEMDVAPALRRRVREPRPRTRTTSRSRGACSPTTTPSASSRACCAITSARAGATLATEAAEARRARNPPPVPVEAPRPAAAREPRATAPRRSRGETPRAAREAAARSLRAAAPLGQATRARERRAGRVLHELGAAGGGGRREADPRRRGGHDVAAAPLHGGGRGARRAPGASRTTGAPRARGAARPRTRASGGGVERDEPPGFVQLFVNVGKREGVRAADLQKLLSEKGARGEPKPDASASAIG